MIAESQATSQSTVREGRIQNGDLALQLIEAAPDSMVIVDSAGLMVLVNQRTEELFGYARGDMLGRPVEVLMPERFRQRHVTHREAFAADPRVRPMGRGLDLYGLHRDGVEFAVEIMLSPIQYGGERLVCAAVRDISEQKIDEAERCANRLILLRMMDNQSRRLADTLQQLHHAEAMATLGVVAAALMHDMSNLLLPVRMRLELLRKECGGQNEHVLAVMRATEYIQDLCTRLGALVGCGATEDDEKAHTNLHRWWREAAPLLSSVLARNITLTFEPGDRLPDVAVPRTELTQAIFNLVHNAGRALADRQDASIRVWARASKQASNVRLGVTDNGPGMPPDVRQSCFKAHFTTRPDAPGAGMGLALVKSIISHVRGDVQVESEPGRGTTFTLILPVWKPDGPSSEH